MSLNVYDDRDRIKAVISEKMLFVPGTEVVICDASVPSDIWNKRGDMSFRLKGDDVVDCKDNILAEIRGNEIIRNGSKIGRFEGPYENGLAAAAVLIMYPDDDRRYEIKNESDEDVAYIKNGILYDLHDRSICSWYLENTRIIGTDIRDFSYRSIGTLDKGRMYDLDGIYLGSCDTDDHEVLLLAATALFFYRRELRLSERVPNAHQKHDDRIVTISYKGKKVGTVYNRRLSTDSGSNLAFYDFFYIYDSQQRRVCQTGFEECILDMNGQCVAKLRHSAVYDGKGRHRLGEVHYSEHDPFYDEDVQQAIMSQGCVEYEHDPHDLYLAMASLVYFRKELGLPEVEKNGSLLDKLFRKR